jgi:hypothetical protein
VPENVENTPTPLDDNAPPLAAAPAEETTAAPVEVESKKEDVASYEMQVDKNGDKIYPSLYDTLPTTFGAIVIGMMIIGTIQWVVKKIYDNQKKESKALTQFVTAMFALIVGIWIADKLIAGPSAQLLYETESREVLTFIKDITLMVFAYYFGTKTQSEGSDSVDS